MLLAFGAHVDLRAEIADAFGIEKDGLDSVRFAACCGLVCQFVSNRIVFFLRGSLHRNTDVNEKSSLLDPSTRYDPPSV